jgi:hypothetical protein
MSTTATIERIRQDEKGWAGTEGKQMYTHIITVGGVDYKYFASSKETTPFEAGKEATYMVETKSNAKGEYFVIKPVKEAKPFKSGGFSGGGKFGGSKSEGSITYLSVFSSVMTGFQQSSEVFDKKKVEEWTEHFYQLAKSKAKDKFSE